MNNGGYTVVQDWMLDFGFDLTSTFVYAIIYGFSQDGESVFQGTQKWLAEKCNCSKDTIKRILKNLTQKGFLIKLDREINGVTFCDYKAAIPKCTSHEQNAPTPGANCTTHNTKDNYIYKEKIYIKKKVEENSNSQSSEIAVESKNGKEKSCAEKEKGKVKFDFYESLLNAGVSEQTASDWLLIRSKKRAVNTATAFKSIKKQLDLAKESGISAEDCILMSVTKSWAGFEYQWYVNEKTKNNGNTKSIIDKRRSTDVLDVPISEYFKPF
ncbi:MAG TPA: hypothetical protein DCW90_01500 [Lachnospiraceae bacterium]|nr:hypothetical protein [Lachnospiraceae bacterium]